MTNQPLAGMGIGRAAEYLGVHPDSLRDWAAAGRVKAIRTAGNRWRFHTEDLDRFVAEQWNVADAEVTA